MARSTSGGRRGKKWKIVKGGWEMDVIRIVDVMKRRMRTILVRRICV